VTDEQLLAMIKNRGQISLSDLMIETRIRAPELHQRLNPMIEAGIILRARKTSHCGSCSSCNPFWLEYYIWPTPSSFDHTRADVKCQGDFHNIEIVVTHATK
jgi:hypothetical protein